jgi:hypothetical protein
MIHMNNIDENVFLLDLNLLNKDEDYLNVDDSDGENTESKMYL